ncbi:hypothetical protein [Brevibacillus daliensis]|uniref:hypothetical protein n=1 Tax=Brevibacillus daliensis TaxID=2892995 RepID=UPI001E350704|nr:hypothetical protein [Brevibacillus daliensis]
MDEKRKQIIVSEIEQWRKNNLLPEHYCIFLLNLYTEGEHAKKGKDQNKADPRKQGESNIKTFGMILLTGIVMAFMVLLASHFNAFQLPMQIAIIALFWLFSYILTFIFRTRKLLLSHVFLLLSLLIPSIALLFFANQNPENQDFIFLLGCLVGVFGVCNGWIFRSRYLMIISLVGIGILYGEAMLTRMGYLFSWANVQLYWVPLAILMTGLGFLFQERNQHVAFALATSGVLYFFGAEITALQFPLANVESIQIFLFAKVILVSILVFFTRSYWIVWLRH